MSEPAIKPKQDTAGKIAVVTIVLILLAWAWGYMSQNQNDKPAPASKTSLSEYTDDELGAYLSSEGSLSVAARIEGSKVIIGYAKDSSWDENDLVFDCAKNAAKVMPVAFGIEGVEAVRFQQATEFSDVYGNSENKIAVAIEVSKETAGKINWEDINSLDRSGLLRVADSIYIHPGIKKNINNEDIIEAVAYQQLNGGF